MESHHEEDITEHVDNSTRREITVILRIKIVKKQVMMFIETWKLIQAEIMPLQTSVVVKFLQKNSDSEVTCGNKNTSVLSKLLVDYRDSNGKERYCPYCLC